MRQRALVFGIRGDSFGHRSLAHCVLHRIHRLSTYAPLFRATPKRSLCTALVHKANGMKCLYAAHPALRHVDRIVCKLEVMLAAVVTRPRSSSTPLCGGYWAGGRRLRNQHRSRLCPDHAPLIIAAIILAFDAVV